MPASSHSARKEADVVALAEELGAQLGRLKGGGPKIKQFLSMVQLDPPSGTPALGALPPTAGPVPFRNVRRVIESDLDARLGELFDDIEDEPFALSSLGQVHRGHTRDGVSVAVKVQHAGAAEAVEADLRGLGFVGPILKRLAPDLDTTAVLAELRERISGELDYEIEAQQQRRVERLLRRHPHVRVPHVHTDLCARRVLVSDYVDGRSGAALASLGEAERDRLGETALGVFLDLAFDHGIVVGDPHVDNCIVGEDGRLWLLDFGLSRDLAPEIRQGERGHVQALLDGDAQRLHRGLANQGYLPAPASVEPQALLAHLATAAEWMLFPGFRRIGPTEVARILELGYPPRSPHFPTMRRLSIPAPTLLLRRMEVQLLALLGDLRAGGDWRSIVATRASRDPAGSSRAPT